MEDYDTSNGVHCALKKYGGLIMKSNMRIAVFTMDTRMIYYYLVRVRFIKGGTSFIKDYRTDYLNIGKLFCFLKKKHRDNYTLVFIRSFKYGG